MTFTTFKIFYRSDIFTQLPRLLPEPSSPWRTGQRQKQTRDRYLSVGELLGQHRQPDHRQQNQHDRRRIPNRPDQVQHQSVRQTVAHSILQPHRSQLSRPDSDPTIKSHRIAHARPVSPILSSSSTTKTLPSSNQGQRAKHQHTDPRDVLPFELYAHILDLGCSHEWQLTDNTQAHQTLPPHDQPIVDIISSSSPTSSATSSTCPRADIVNCTLGPLPIARYVPPPARRAQVDRTTSLPRSRQSLFNSMQLCRRLRQ